MYNNNGQKILCTIEARMSSSRLPGKVLLPLGGEPSLKRQIERIQKSKYVDQVVVATTVNQSDDLIVEMCESINCNYYRGSEEDVLSRVLEAARKNEADLMVESTGDCPLVDPVQIDRLIEFYYSSNYDYVANRGESRGYPVGFDLEVFALATLEEAEKSIEDPVHRIHVSSSIYSQSERYKLAFLDVPDEMYWPELRLTLDEEDDYNLLKKLYEEFMIKNPLSTVEEIVFFLRGRPDLVAMNQHVRQKHYKKVNEEISSCRNWMWSDRGGV